MKKLVSLLLCFIVSLSAFACSANQTKKNMSIEQAM